jgi:metal-responsive CopG/Arc/MetJ family transcriptional regulator
MGRSTKVIGFSVPPALAEEVEQVAKAERRTKSELFREMLRVYQHHRQQREREEERWVMELIREA